MKPLFAICFTPMVIFLEHFRRVQELLNYYCSLNRDNQDRGTAVSPNLQTNLLHIVRIIQTKAFN